MGQRKANVPTPAPPKRSPTRRRNGSLVTQHNRPTKHRNLASALATKLDFDPARDEEDQPTPTVQPTTTIKTKEVPLKPAALPDFDSERVTSSEHSDISDTISSVSPTVTNKMRRKGSNDMEIHHDEDLFLHAGNLKMSKITGRLNIWEKIRSLLRNHGVDNEVSSIHLR